MQVGMNFVYGREPDAAAYTCSLRLVKGVARVAPGDRPSTSCHRFRVFVLQLCMYGVCMRICIASCGLDSVHLLGAADVDLLSASARCLAVGRC